MALPKTTPKPTNLQAPEQAPFRYRQVALDWARSRLVNGLSLTPRERHVLIELCMWCGPKVGFEPAPPLRATATYPGILDKTGLTHHNYLQIVSRLARKGIIEKVSQGGGSRPRSEGGRMWITHTRWRLLVPSVSLEVQPSMDLDFRTAVEKPMKDSHGLSEKPMKDSHGLLEKPMKDSHGLLEKPMKDSHGLLDLSFNSTSNMTTSNMTTSNRLAGRPAGDEKNDGDETDETVLFSDKFLRCFIERANRAFDLLCGPHCPPGCKYHIPIIEAHVSHLGGGSVDPGIGAADKVIADTLAASPRSLLRYLTTCLGNLLLETDRHFPAGEPTLPEYRTAAPPEPPPPPPPLIGADGLSNFERIMERRIPGYNESIRKLRRRRDESDIA